MKEPLVPIITATALHDLMNRSEARPIDARQGAGAHQKYLQSHLKGALWVDLENDLSRPMNPRKGGRHPLPEPEQFAVLLGKLGITPDTHLVIYDDTSGAIAGARLWWMLRAIGHEKVQVLDGGLKAAILAGVPTASGVENIDETAPYPLSSWQLPMAALDAVKKISEHGKGVIVDVRSAARYRGDTEPIDPIAGHIPGAINIPYQDSLDEEGKFLSPSQLRHNFNNLLPENAKENTVVHCGSGVTACHTLLAMDLAGLELPALYVGSWSEWCRVEG